MLALHLSQDRQRMRTRRHILSSGLHEAFVFVNHLVLYSFITFFPFLVLSLRTQQLLYYCSSGVLGRVSRR